MKVQARGDPGDSTQRDLVAALVRCLGDHFSIDLDPAGVDPNATFLENHSIVIEGNPLDSLDLVDALVSLEDQLQVRLTDGDLQKLDTFNRLASAILKASKPDSLEEFCGRWG